MRDGRLQKVLLDPRMSRTSLLEGVEHVVWDWNGTLLDDLDHCVRVINGMLAEHELGRIDRDQYRAVFEFPVRRYYERLGFDLSGERFELLARRFIDAYDRDAEACSLHDGVPSVLGSLAARGTTSSILTAARTASVESMLVHHRIAGCFSAVAGLDDHYAAGKIERGRSWLRESGLDAERLLLVGDTVHDHEVGDALGVRVVLVAAGHHAADRLAVLGCPVLERIEALLE